MKGKENQQCVICHKDITSELPKIDIYGNHYCKDCYIEKCKYELMNMRDTILINKELLKRELQYLEEQTQKHTRKETAEKFANEVYKELYQLGKIYALPETFDADKYGIFSLTQEVIARIAKEHFNIEIKE